MSVTYIHLKFLSVKCSKDMLISTNYMLININFMVQITSSSNTYNKVSIITAVYLKVISEAVRVSSF